VAIFQKSGGFTKAKADFYSIAAGKAVMSKGEGKLFVRLSNQESAMVREYSSDGRPTLEIWFGKSRRWKVRYDG
jgi:hypothetical protein